MGAVFGVLVFAVMVMLVLPQAASELPVIPAVGLLQAVMGALISAITSMLMFEHAKATGRRGYLAIALTYLYLAAVLAVFPLTFPGAFIEGEALFGTAQTPVGLFFAWHFAVPVGLSAATLMLYKDEKRFSRAQLRPSHIRLSLGLTVLGIVVTVLMAMQWPVPLLPDTFLSSGALSPFSQILKAAALLLSVAFLAIAAYCARNGSVILSWLAAAAVLGAGEALVSFFSMQRYTVSWYFSRIVWLVAVSVLLFALIRSLSRVADANVALGAVDGLTGVASRSAFLQAVDREIARSRIYNEQLALIWFDLDGFKDVNDQLGQEIGDQVLRRIAHRIQGQLQHGDTVGRLGGDAFGVLLCDRDEPAALDTADRLLAEVKRPIQLPDACVSVTAAAGVGMSPRDASGTDSLLKCADLALLTAKRESGDRSIPFDEGMGARERARDEMRRELTDGLRNGQFGLYYQPIYRLGDMTMAGCEALARWWRGTNVLPAGQWIPVAESTGQIVSVSHQLLDCLVADLPEWIAAQDHRFFVTFNLSTRELGDANYVARLKEALAPFSDRVLLEVTSVPGDAGKFRGYRPSR